jgi:hypothetical protein
MLRLMLASLANGMTVWLTARQKLPKARHLEAISSFYFNRLIVGMIFATQ